MYYYNPVLKFLMGGRCDRCNRSIEFRKDAVFCTHFGSLPTISHRACAQLNFPNAPPVVLKIGVDMLPLFFIVNLLNLVIGIIALMWGIIELTQPQDTSVYAPVLPMGLLIGPFMIGIGVVLIARIQKLNKLIPPD